MSDVSDMVNRWYATDQDAASNTHGAKVRAESPRVGDARGWSDAKRAAHEAEVIKALYAAQMNSDQAQKAYSRFVATATGAPVDDATRNSWAIEMRRQAREQFGSADEVTRRLERVQAFVSQHGDFGRELIDTGLLHHPDVALPLLERANVLPVEEK